MATIYAPTTPYQPTLPIEIPADEVDTFNPPCGADVEFTDDADGIEEWVTTHLPSCPGCIRNEIDTEDNR